MKDQAMNADDPRLTAYALGELSGEDAAEVAAAIERDPALAAEIDEIRAMTGDLADALRAEDLPETEPVDMTEHIEFPMDKRAPKRFPYYWVSGLAAAGFAVLVMVQSPESPLVGRETTIAAPRNSTANQRPQTGMPSPMVSMPPLEKTSAEPERYADDVILDEVDYSEKDRFVIAVDSAPMPSPVPEAVEKPRLEVASATSRLNGERADNAVVASADAVEERLLTSAGTVATAKEKFERSRGPNRAQHLESDFGLGTGNPKLGERTLSGTNTYSGQSTEAVQAPLEAEEVVELSPFMVSDAPDVGYADAATLVSSGSLQAQGNKPADNSLNLSNTITADGVRSHYYATTNSYGGTIQTRGSAQLVTSLRDSGGVPFGSIAITKTSALRIEDHSSEDYAAIEDQGWQRVVDHPLSTFAVDVDSASYANVRRFLQSGNLPPRDAVKVEELVNAFSYDYRGPEVGSDAPLMANLEVAAAPWNPEHRLVRIGLKAEEMPTAERGAANLVFLMDVSGSMNSPKNLPLVKEALRLLLGKLRDDDRVAIVTYAGWSGLALPSTPVSRKRAIETVLRDLKSGGSTNGALGIHLAYDIAKANFVPGGVNRVILCTDGDFNVGTTGLGELGELITEKAQSDVFLTALGFGMGNYQDDTLEQLANKGNGHHGYIDSVREARRLLVEQVEGTLNTVARDVKIQVEFNPAQVAAYRLIGYDNRRLAPEEFNNDTIDAGEIGAGHTVTALYEVIPAGERVNEPTGVDVDALRYQALPETGKTHRSDHVASAEMLTVKLRAQPPAGGESRKWEFYLTDEGRAFEDATPDFKFASAVAGFGLVLRDHPSVASSSLAQVEGWARSGITDDPGEYRAEFVELVGRANGLITQ
jgi:secreted protein with Ig-like and vWFA domain